MTAPRFDQSAIPCIHPPDVFLPRDTNSEEKSYEGGDCDAIYQLPHKFLYFRCERGMFGLDTQGKSMVEGWLNNNSPSNPKLCHKPQCSNKLMYDSVLCNYHLYTDLNLSVAPSQILLAHGIYTLALYCGRPYDTTTHKTKKTNRQPAIVFKAAAKQRPNTFADSPSFVCEYRGEYLDKFQADARYDYHTPYGDLSEKKHDHTHAVECTGPYLVRLGRTDHTATSVIDASVQRSIGAYANDAERAPTKVLANAAFVLDPIGRTAYIRALRPIKQGDEIWVTYREKMKPKLDKVSKKQKSLMKSVSEKDVDDTEFNYWTGLGPQYTRHFTVEVTREADLHDAIVRARQGYDLVTTPTSRPKRGAPKKTKSKPK
jgi:hypothetical protein